MKILACGSRDWTDVQAMEKALDMFPSSALLIHGDNGYDANGKALWGQPDELAVKGADKLAGKVARKRGMPVKVFTPDWKIGPSAGPRRNREQVKENPDVLIVFHPDVTRGVGTKDMVKVALKAGVKQFVLVKSASDIAKLSDEEVTQLLKSA